MDFNKLTREFLTEQWKDRPSIRAHVEAITRLLESLKLKSQREQRQVSIIKQHLRDINRLNKKLEHELEKLHDTQE